MPVEEKQLDFLKAYLDLGEDSTLIEVRDALLLLAESKGANMIDELLEQNYLTESYRELVFLLASKLVQGVDLQRIIDYCQIVRYRFEYIKPILFGDQIFYSSITDLDPLRASVDKETMKTMRGIQRALVDLGKVMKEIKILLKEQSNGSESGLQRNIK